MDVIAVEAEQWTVRIHLTEDGDATHTRALLRTRNTSAPTGRGSARRNPTDRPVPGFAASRVL
ncbi:dsRBD fold-containing protein [Streptomyces levis]|uniref:Uncharacterized protein n=1 Tax=Streptomyces levis TaxID=285566 RepID=A0ABN3NWT1_9ACTN